MTPPDATEAALKAASAASPRGLCVLVVEDDEADVYLIGRALADHPSIADIVYASDGVEAFEMVDRGDVEPDVAFIDLHMPRKNGFSLLTAFACDPELNFPMVVLTSSVAPADVIRSRLRGASRVVTKPDSVEAMQAALASAIGAVCPKRPPADQPNCAPEPSPARFSPASARSKTPRFSVTNRQPLAKGPPEESAEDKPV
jgi:CheY-like chemotaxis protein